MTYIVCTCVTLIICTVNPIFGSSRYYMRDVTFDSNVRPSSGYSSRIYSRSGIECGVKCDADAGCKSYFFTKSSSISLNCQLHDHLMAAGDVILLGSEAASVTVYFTVFICPMDDDWAKAILPDSTTFFVKFITDQYASRDESRTQCADEDGGTLMKLTTLDKMNFVKDVIVTCPTISGKSFWIDGSNENAMDYYAADAWKTFDGTQVPMSVDDFWSPGRPNYPGEQFCIWLTAVKSYLFDDYYCSSNSETVPVCETDTISS